MNKFYKPVPIFLIVCILGFLAIAYNQFPAFVVVMLALLMGEFARR